MIVIPKFTKEILVLFITLTFFSCSFDREKNGSAELERRSEIDTAITISGCWISEDYLSNIKQNKSPRRAQANAMFIVIPEGDRPAMMIYNFHEGGPSMKIVKGKRNFQAWEEIEDSLVKKLYDIEIDSSGKITMEGKTFVKINLADKDKILEEILFKGIYTDTKGQTIEFKNNGEIAGMNNFHSFEPVIDYMDAGLQVDQVGMKNQTDSIEKFGFKFNGDTLELYKLICMTYDSIGKSCVEVDFGQLYSKLWKK